MLHQSFNEPTRLHFLSCQFARQLLPYLSKHHLDCLNIDSLSYLRGQNVPIGTALDTNSLNNLLNIKDSYPRYTKCLRRNIQFLLSLTEGNTNGASIIEFVLICQANKCFMSLVEHVQLYNDVWSIDDILREITGITQADLDRVINDLYDLGLLTSTNLNAIVGDEIPKALMTKLLTQPLTQQEELLDALLLPSKPAQFTLDSFHQVNTGLISDYLNAAIEEAQLGTNLLFYGTSGAGKTELARSLADENGLHLFEVRASGIKGGRLKDEFESKSPDKDRLRYLSLITALLSSSYNAMLLIDECESLFESADNQYSKDHLQRFLEDNHIPCIWITNHVDYVAPSFIRRFKLVIEVTSPNAENIDTVCQQYYKGLALSKQFKRTLAHISSISPAIIANATHVAKTLGNKRTSAENTVLEVVNSTMRASNILTEPAQYKGDLCFNPNLLNIRQNRALLDDVRYALKHNKPARILLTGPPGTGKTAYAHYLTELHERDLIRVKCSDVLSKWSGESEQNVAELFHRAHSEEKVILLDEVDSLLVSREALTTHHELQLVNEFLTQIECFSQPLFAATNFDSKLDKAVLRRFDFKLECDYLTSMQVIQLYKHVLAIKKLTLEEKRSLALMRHLTPGDFAILARRQMFQPSQDHRLSAITLLAEENQRKQPKNQMGFIRPL
ncbi:AAA family ATPase [Paraglaciecola aquimarina]|uniref:AAA family ATPase n=1 Tax=Paraglaciecola algarum TaxID=3050085 RepID=A0ABS9DA48_9ALTE|nr:AAA family ATPase [Paraglaciecola sp. G1-23]MCF2949262.1 AAA family ATPase [Paraglaciecola sp. G1-23]